MKKKLSFDEHVEIARKLHEVRSILMDVDNKIAFRIGVALDKMRDELEEELYNNYPGACDTSIYYPGKNK